jgi:hypothetical protein
VKDLCPCVRAAAKDFAIGTSLYGGLALFSVSIWSFTSLVQNPSKAILHM